MRVLHFRYSLRALLLVIAAVSGWCAFHSHRARLEQRVEQAVLAAGGRVTCGPVDLANGSKPIPPSWYARLVQTLFGERHISVVNLNFCPANIEVIEGVADLPHLRSFLAMRAKMDDAKLTVLLRNERLERLVLADKNTAITDAGCRSLHKLQHLKWLSLDDTQVSDTTLHAILGLKQLEQINLSFTQIRGQGMAAREGLGNLRSFQAERCDLSDDFLKWLSKCPSLEMARLEATGITDAGVEHFAGHQSLVRLVLSNNRRVTDKSFEYLAGCPNLKHLQVGISGVSRAGMEAFRQRRPDVELR